MNWLYRIIFKRIFDFTIALVGLITTGILILLMMLLVWLHDFHNPLYISQRIGKNGKPYKMIKLRSMIIDADKTGVDSTSATDNRITPIGYYIRKFKFDEIMQLWNVLIGNMSLVGPRPNVAREVNLYTEVERKLLRHKPGITDMSSIVFADLAEILQDSKDPNIDYNQLVRPWKSRLGLFYVENVSFLLDIKLIALTLLNFISRQKALDAIAKVLKNNAASEAIIDIAKRKTRLVPHPPPGTDKVVTSRD